MVRSAIPSIPCPICGQAMRWEEKLWACRAAPYYGGPPYRPCTDTEIIRDALAPVEEAFLRHKRQNPHFADTVFYDILREDEMDKPVVHFQVDTGLGVLGQAHFVRAYPYPDMDFIVELVYEPDWSPPEEGTNLTRHEQAAILVAAALASTGWRRRPWWVGFVCPSPLYLPADEWV